MDQWTPKVTARATLAEALKGKPALVKAVGLTMDDLDALITHGNAAQKADAEQKEQLATIAVSRSGRKDDAQSVFSREDAMRDRLPAVVGDLVKGNQKQLADWLTNLSFARYRFRDLTVSDASAATAKDAPAATGVDASSAAAKDADVAKVQRVAREDIPTRLTALSSFCAALVKPGREAIVASFAERGISGADLTELAADAEALAKAGRNTPRGADATDTETKEAKAQRLVWAKVRRMVRKAVQGNPDLAQKFADC